MTDFCRFCGASVPHREGEGRCPRCEHHATLFYRAECDRLRAEHARLIRIELAAVDTSRRTTGPMAAHHLSHVTG